jgi:tRNA (guanine26-N2/guanine27-N2)-dimethyltransferase
MKLKKIKEGKVSLSVPEGRIYDASVFYNKEGEMNRDISVSAIQIFQKEFKEKITVCDALSATGARGLRYAKEISEIKEVILNDKNPMALKLIRKNIKENKLSKKCIVSKEDANILMRKNVFIVIDIDPFGSPNIFMDSAARSVYHRGFLCVTATDQSALAGTYPNSCFRKYGIKTVRTEFYNELGVRILLSFIILNLSKYDRAFMPVMSFADKHYYRVFGKIEHAGKISDLLKEFKYVSYCTCGNWIIGTKEKCSCGKKFDLIGPVYLGSIMDKKFCKKVLADIRKRNFNLKKQEEKLLSLLVAESDMPPFYYDIHFLAKKFGFKIPKTEYLIKKVKSKGFKATRTHFCPTAIKTDAETKVLKKILK